MADKKGFFNDAKSGLMDTKDFLSKQITTESIKKLFNDKTSGLLDQTKAVQTSNGLVKSSNDPRARLTLKPSDFKFIQNDAITAPLREFGGVVFPYTPAVNYGAKANYEQYDLTQNNFKINAWKSSSINDISMTAKFTAQTVEEATYVLAVIHFLKFITKGHTGSSTFAGVSPPVLNFNYMGPLMFDNVPVVVSDFSFDIDADISTVPVSYAGVVTNIPTYLEMQIMLLPQYIPQDMRDFKIEDFVNGKYLTKKGYL